MRRTERLQELKLMKFEELYGHIHRGASGQCEAAAISGVSERAFRRWRDRYEAEGADGLHDRRRAGPRARYRGLDRRGHEADYRRCARTRIGPRPRYAPSPSRRPPSKPQPCRAPKVVHAAFRTIPNAERTEMTAADSAPDAALDAERVNVLYYWDIFKRGKLLMAGLTLGFAALGAGAAFVIEPVYKSTVTMISADRGDANLDIGGGLGSSLQGLSSLAQIDLSPFIGGSGVKQEALAILKSRGFVSKFIEQRNLMPVLFDKEDFAARNPEKIPTLQDAYEKFSEDILDIHEDIVENTIKLNIYWKDPTVGSNWANSLVTEINSHMRKDTIEETQKSIAYLEKVLPNVEIIQIQQAIYELIQAQIHKSMLAETRENYAFKVIDSAVPADSDRFVRPRRVLITLSASVLGLLIGGFSVIWRDYIRRVSTAPVNKTVVRND